MGVCGRWSDEEERENYFKVVRGMSQMSMGAVESQASPEAQKSTPEESGFAKSDGGVLNHTRQKSGGDLAAEVPTVEQ